MYVIPYKIFIKCQCFLSVNGICTCRNQQTAKIFAIKYGIPNAMEGYEALAACDYVNVVYVGTINTTHLDVVKVMKQS